MSTQQQQQQQQSDSIGRLKKKPEVAIKDGFACFTSDFSGVWLEKRFGLPVLNKKREPVRLLGAFKDAEEVYKWLNQEKEAGRITEKRYSAAINDLTDYFTLAESERSKFESEQGVSPIVKVKVKKEKESPKPKKSPGAKSAPASSASSTTATGGAYVIFNEFDAMEIDKHNSAAPNLGKAILGNSGTNQQVVRMELIAVPSHDLVLLKRLEAPAQGLMKQVAKQLSVTADQLKVDREHGRDSKYMAVISRSSLKSAFKRKTTEEKRNFKIKQTRDDKQKKALKKRADAAKELTVVVDV